MQELGRRKSRNATRVGAAMPSFRQYVELARGIARDLAIFLFCKTLYYAWPSKLRSLVPVVGAGRGSNEAMAVAGMKYMSSLNFVWQRTRRAKKNMRICAEEGEPYPDFPLVELENMDELRLSDLVKKVGAQPIVLNFGSCS